MPFVETDESKVFFRVDGSGPGLLLLHGTGGNSETNWGPLVGHLTEERTVIRPDYSGSGKTVDDGASLTVSMLASQAIAAADKAGVSQFDLVGFSLGAAVATYIAAEYPDRVRSVILLAGFATNKDTRQILSFELWRDLIHTDREAMARFMLVTGLSPDFLATMDYHTMSKATHEIVETNNWEGMARQVELNLTLDVSEHAQRITQPALVIGCTYDWMVPSPYSRQLADIVPSARYQEIATGHLATIEKPDEVARLVLDFISTSISSSD
ncbi:alpha/beta fold hydrolase [Salinicola corii]|uniref:Alpha/beta fold hydrolase n=1 Tax=Salinicola corii TaxID=2606937 RepID=A0A640WJ12_9GAMM|nr:alpha/beta hydrolase [Salinicola corii]KAA0020646.1 alpha/beta fold hydrolase [Salinicola corii]